MFSECTSSGLKTADALILTGSGWLMGVVLNTGTADSSVIVYDNTSAAGTVVAKATINAGTEAGDAGREYLFPVPVRVGTGIYADVGGTAAEYIVYFKRG